MEDILECEEPAFGMWKGWKNEKLHDQLQGQWKTLLGHLKGANRE